jgi:hypothetical protein
MKYMLLIYANESGFPAEPAPEELQAEMDAYNAFGAEAAARGVMVDGDALMPINTATSVRVREGKTLTTDGPFAETHEQLGGYYILDCKDLDEAIEFAAKIPGSKHGTVEIRPLVVWE